MKKNTCAVPEQFQHYFQECFNSYSMNADEEEHFKPGWNESVAEEEADASFTYRSAMQLAGEPADLAMGTYSGGGYVADLGRDAQRALNLTSSLIATNWLDERTRVVFIELLAFNPSTQLFTSASLAVEFFAGGSTETTSTITTMKMSKYSGTNGMLLIVMQLVCLLFIVYYMYAEVVQLIRERMKYFTVRLDSLT